jgi:hypothetical protein
MHSWTEYPTKSLDLINVIRQNRRLLSMVVSVELGYVVYLHIILDAISKAVQSASTLLLLYSKGDLHAVTSWSVSVVLTTLQILAVVILELLLEWQSVECASQGELAIDLFLADIEVLHIEETCYISIGFIQKACLYLPTCRTAWSNCFTSSSLPPGCSYRLRSSVINSAQSTVYLRKWP